MGVKGLWADLVDLQLDSEGGQCPAQANAQKLAGRADGENYLIRYTIAIVRVSPLNHIVRDHGPLHFCQGVLRTTGNTSFRERRVQVNGPG